MDNFDDLIEKERANLAKLEEDYTTQIADLQLKLAAIERRRRAFDAYHATMQDAPTTRTTRSPKGTKAPRGSKREELIAIIRAHPGVTRAEILTQTGAKGNKASEGAVSNALTIMKKAGTIALDSGKYTVAGG